MNIPYECGMLAHQQCVFIIGTWTVGSFGDCFHDSSGFRIGLGGFKRVALQVREILVNRTQCLFFLL